MGDDDRPSSDGPDPRASATRDADVAGLVRQHWRRRADTFDDEPEHAMHSEAQREAWLDVLAEWTRDPPRRILDAGCGTGTVSVLLAELGHEVVGVDAAPEMIGRARSKAAAAGHEVSYALGDVTALGVVDDAFDHLVERHVLWTLPDPAAVLAEWRRVVEPGGRLVLFEGKWTHHEVRGEYEAVHGDLPMYDGRSAAEMREFLADAGLVDVTSAPLMDPVLRGREDEPEHDYFVVAGRNPV